jgi:hypothetical protein
MSLMEITQECFVGSRADGKVYLTLMVNGVRVQLLVDADVGEQVGLALVGVSCEARRRIVESTSPRPIRLANAGRLFTGDGAYRSDR